MKTYTYTVLFEYFKDESTEGYHVAVPALPEIVTWGRTLEEAKANAAEALECVLESRIQEGEPVPSDVTIAQPVHVEKMPIQV
jgi:predicted RNase H-like HicB family nuclease